MPISLQLRNNAGAVMARIDFDDKALPHIRNAFPAPTANETAALVLAHCHDAIRDQVIQDAVAKQEDIDRQAVTVNAGSKRAAVVADWPER